MTRINDLKSKLLITAGYIAILCVFAYFGINCFFESIFHIPCPGCGMSRAIVTALSFDFISAFQYHGMFWSMPLLYLYFLFDGKLFKNKIINIAVFIGIAVGFLIVWILKIIEFLSG